MCSGGACTPADQAFFKKTRFGGFFSPGEKPYSLMSKSIHAYQQNHAYS
jgi:hypothetical protein